MILKHLETNSALNAPQIGLLPARRISRPSGFRSTLRGVFSKCLQITIVSSAVASVYAGSVTCTNGPNDPAAVQAAVNAGGTVTINGNCNFTASQATVNVSRAVSINGPATITLDGAYQSSNTAFNVSANNVSITGLTFTRGTAVHVWGGSPPNQYFVFSNNTVSNTNASDALVLDPIMQYATISGNSFSSIAPDGFASFVFNGSACYTATSTCDLPGTGISGLSGWDNSRIENNNFDLISGDAIHLSFDLIAQDRYYFLTQNVSVSYNQFSRIHRMAIEFQGASSYVGCVSPGNPANCHNLANSYSSNLKIAGNYAHDFFQGYIETFGFSLVHHADGQHINNSAILNSPTGDQAALAQETDGGGILTQGNVYAADYLAKSKPHGWGQSIVYAGQVRSSDVYMTQNNVLCTDGELTNDFGFEAGSKPTVVNQFNYRANSCPSAGQLTTSAIKMAYVGASLSGANETLSFSVINNLSIRNVQFFLDGSNAPMSTQEVQDVNNNFAADRKWLYHATVDTSHLGGGGHSLTAKATDVSGASASVTASFTVGAASAAASSGPTAQITPGSVSFGSQMVGLPSGARSLTITNTGTASMIINSVTLSGANPNDFAPSSGCSSSIAPGSSCTISAVFTPSTVGTSTAYFLISDDAAGSPQTASLTGTGIAAPAAAAAVSSVAAAGASSAGAISSLPASLPNGMILWLANDAGVTSNGQSVSLWKDQSGNGADAMQTSTANQPKLLPANNQQNGVQFDGNTSFMTIASLPISGLTGMTVFIVSANNNDLTTGFGISSLLSWPETASWGTTFFGTYQTSSHFRFGTTQAGNENSYSFPFSRSNSFGLSEFLHSGVTDSMWFNGQAVASFPGKLQMISGTGNSALLGQGINSSFYPGQLSEIIVYSRNLADSERQLVEQYLMGKYHL